MSADVFRSFTYQCDPAMHRVTVTDANGCVVLEFGGFGRQPGAFDTPIDATLVMPEFFGEPLDMLGAGRNGDADGAVEPWLAVADYGNRRVQIFELDGALVGVIDEDVLGDAAGGPCRPCGLVWRDPVLEVEGVDGGKVRLHLGAALLQSDVNTMLPSASPAMFVARGAAIVSGAELAVQTVSFAPPAIGADEISEVVSTLSSGWLSTGPRVREFERAFADYIGVPHAVAVNSCTAALHLALLATGVGPGDEVVTTPLTFCATANVIIHAGATPRFADIDPITWNLTAHSAASVLTKKTRAVVPVHYAGRPVDVSAFRHLATRKGLVLIEDAAHAVEASAAGAKIGVTGDVTCFSFYATKNLTTGEGGMFTTSSDEWASYARVASLHGMSRDAWARYGTAGSPHYDVVMAGFKYNMMDLQAAIGLHQLKGLNARLCRRESIWRQYDEAFEEMPITRPAPVRDGDVHARHLYTILVTPDSGWTRDEFAQALRADGISTSVHFRALHLQPYYAERYGLTRGMFPVAEMVSDCELSLPLSGGMTDGDASAVISSVVRHLRRGRR